MPLIVWLLLLAYYYRLLYYSIILSYVIISIKIMNIIIIIVIVIVLIIIPFCYHIKLFYDYMIIFVYSYVLFSRCCFLLRKNRRRPHRRLAQGCGITLRSLVVRSTARTHFSNMLTSFLYLFEVFGIIWDVSGRS